MNSEKSFDPEFMQQLAARMQAHEFLILALLRGHLHAMTPAEAQTLCAGLERDFATITVPSDARPDADLDALMTSHRDAQFFLARLLKRASPPHPDEAGRSPRDAGR